MKKGAYFVIILMAGIFAFGCQSQVSQEKKESDESTDSKGEVFGALVTPDQAIAPDQLAERYAGEDSVRVKLTAEVTEVCQNKGCWMNLASEEEGQEIMVRFKDYGFFVPKDIAGRQVVIEGLAQKELISVEDLRHYAKDKGASADEIEAINEPQEKWTFLADGVLLLER